ncbi:MAG: translocation/assembly module TamB domain-containing protein [Saccharospirillum sp.]
MAIRLRAVAVHAWLTALKVMLALLVLVALGVGYLLGTESGRLLLVNQAQTWVPRLTGQQLLIEGARSPGLGEWRFGRLEWQLPESGLSVALAEVSLAFEPSYLFSRRVWVEQLEARAARVQLPQASASADAGPAAPPDLDTLQQLWQRIPAIQVERLAVGELRLQRSGLADLTTSIDAEFEVNWGWPIRLEAMLADGPASRLQATALVDAADALRLTGELNTAGDSAWAQWLQWPLAEPVVGRWDLWLRADNGWATLDIDELVLPWRNHTLRSTGQLGWQFDQARLRLDDWQVWVDEHPARLDGFVEAQAADLNIEVARLPWSLAQGWVDVPGFEGDLSVSGQLSGGWRAPTFQGEAGFTGEYQGEPLTARLTSTATADALNIERLAVNWAQAQASAQGEVSWRDEQLDLTLGWQGISEDRWQSWVAQWPQALSLTVQGEGRLQGPLLDPQLRAELRAEGRYEQEALNLELALAGHQRQITAETVRLRTDKGQVTGQAQLDLANAQLTTELEIADVQSSWLAAFGIELPVQHDALLNAQLSGGGPFTDPAFAGAVQVDGQWQAQPASLQATFNQLTLRGVRLEQLELTLAEARVQSRGRVDWQQQQLNLTGELDNLRVRMVRPLMPEIPPWLDDLAGGVDARFQVSGSWLEPQVTTDLNFAGRWLDQPLTASLSVANETAQRWRIPEARLEWAQLRLGYTGTVWPFEQRLDGEFDLQRLRTEDVARLPFDLPAEWQDIDGELNLTAAVSGEVLNPDVRGQLDFQGQWQAQPLNVTVDVDQVNTEGIRISRARLRSGESSLLLSGTLAWQPLTVDLEARLDNAELAQWLPLIPNRDDYPLDSLTGRLSGALSVNGSWPSARLDGELSGSGDYLSEPWTLDWAGQGQWDDALSHLLAMNWGPAGLSVDLVNRGKTLDGRLEVNGVTLAQLAALGLDAGPEFSGSLAGAVDITGAITDPDLNLTLNGNGRWLPEHQRLNGGTDWRVNLAANGRLQQWVIEQGSADLGPAGTLTLSGQGDAQQLALQAQIDVPELRFWLPDQPELHGRLNSRLTVAGSQDAPDIDLNLTWQSASAPLRFLLEVDTLEGEHRVASQLVDDGLTRLSLDLATEQTALADWQGDLAERPFRANLTLDADATILAPLLREVPDQSFEGNLRGALSIFGTLNEPQWEGQAELTDGRYENAALGAILSDIDARLTADRRELVLDLAARDGGSGRVSLDGEVLWQQDRGDWWLPELDLVMDLNSARILRRVDIEATADGRLTVTGPWQDLLVAGTIDVIPLTIRLNNVLQSTGSGLNVVRDDSENSNGNGASPAAADSPYLPDGRWQVRLRADRRAQIFGQGLVAELAGELDITDDLLQPAIGGRFEIVRGTYTAFGRIFNLDRGTIQIQGSQILLDIYGVYVGDDLRVELNIAGNQDRLGLTLTSIPSLANDELLARLLFGRSVQEMSAFEAIILANELNKLRNPGAGGDILGDTRERLGLDALIIDTESNEAGETGINIAAGKYLSDRIYVEVETGVGTEQSFAGSLQLILTPNINLELYTRGQFNSGGLELNWSNDY